MCVCVCVSPNRAPLRGVGVLYAKVAPASFLAATALHARSLTSGVNLDHLALPLRDFIEEHRKVLQPQHVHVCDGSEEENQAIIKQLRDTGRLTKLEKYKNW